MHRKRGPYKRMTEIKGSPIQARRREAASKAGSHRRHSVADFLNFKRKSPLKGFKQEISALEEDEEEPEPVWEKLNEKLHVAFADRSDSGESEGHVNRIFQTEKTERHRYFASAFGKKGRKKEEYDDVKDIAWLDDDRVLTTDLTNSRLHLCDKDGQLLMIYAGSDLSEPWAVAPLKNNQFAVSSCKNKCINIITVRGDFVKSFGDDFFKQPAGVAVDSKDQFIVCDTISNTVSIHKPDGGFKRYLGNSGNPKQTFCKPRYVCVSSTGDIIVSDSGNHSIKIFDCEGSFVRSFGSYGKGQSQMKFPYGVCTSKYGEIYVADHYNNRITTFSRDGVFIHHLVSAVHGLRRPQGITLTTDMKLYVSHGELKANEILIFHLNSSTVYKTSEYTSHM